MTPLHTADPCERAGKKWSQVDAAQAWRCTQCSDFVHTGWVWWETPTVSTHALCDHCVAEILKGGARK